MYKTKIGADGSILRRKACLVSRGYSQKYGVDFEETYSLVAQFETMRMLLALAAQQRWEVYRLKVKSTFSNGELQEGVYVEQPKGFMVDGSEAKVYRFRKALYGLKQAPEAWYSKINSHFLHHGFQRCESEPT